MIKTTTDDDDDGGCGGCCSAGYRWWGQIWGRHEQQPTRRNLKKRQTRWLHSQPLAWHSIYVLTFILARSPGTRACARLHAQTRVRVCVRVHVRMCGEHGCACERPCACHARAVCVGCVLRSELCLCVGSRVSELSVGVGMVVC